MSSVQQSVQLIIFSFLLAMASFAGATHAASVLKSQAHAKNLKDAYPFGLLSDDYGILTIKDLKMNTRGVQVGPFDRSNQAYPYWQCFKVKDLETECSLADYDRSEKMQLAIFSIDGKLDNHFHSYLSRRAIPLPRCLELLRAWKAKVRTQRYVCLSGSYATDFESRTRLLGTVWTFDKFKSRSGCESFTGASCSK